MKAPCLSAAGGHSQLAPTPTIAHSPGSGFTISNHDAGLVYALSAGTRTGSGITLAMSTPATLTAKAPKGVTATTAITLERRTITYSQPVFHQTGTIEHFNPCTGGYHNCSGGVHYPGGSSGDGCYSWEATGYYTYDGEDGAPSGFTKLSGEWVRIA